MYVCIYIYKTAKTDHSHNALVDNLLINLKKKFNKRSLLVCPCEVILRLECLCYLLKDYIGANLLNVCWNVCLPYQSPTPFYSEWNQQIFT